MSAYIWDGLTKEGQGRAIVLNGHAYTGCDTYHYSLSSGENTDYSLPDWEASRWHLAAPRKSNETLQGLCEITVQSMMGSYSGNAGLLSGWCHQEDGQWRFEYARCMLGVQHIWWGVHVFAIVELILGVVGVVLWVREVRTEESPM